MGNVSRPLRTLLFTVPALIGFAANSLLCRKALGLRWIDPFGFTAIRLVAGAAALALIVAVARRTVPRGGSWISAGALFLYAAAFSASYVRIGAGVGSLLLFGAVQVTMLFWGLVRGERLGGIQWAGIVLAVSGLALLTLPGAHAPSAIGASLMVAAGIAWGLYSLRGRGNRDPLPTTTDNFIRSLPFCAALLLSFRDSVHATIEGVGLAVISGAVTSGIGYSLWYAALPFLTATRAAAVQLSVPVLAAVGAVFLLGEHLTLRLLLAGAAILIGVWLAIQKHPNKIRRV
jgi:drug/metabolite transporter (DMT)-like permease